MSYYARAPELRTRAVQMTRPLAPMLRTGRVVLSTPSWLEAQRGSASVTRARLWNRIPVSLVEGREPVPFWDILGNRGF